MELPFIGWVSRDGARTLARALFEPTERVAVLDEALEPGAVVEVGPGPVRVLARAGSARAELYGIAARYGLDPVFPAAVAAEAASWEASPDLDDPALADWTHLPFVTIDNPGSRDLDQALHIERRGDGPGYVVRYALADASHYVRPGSALWDEALRRGASYYLPGFSIPMLPRVLSEGLVSLEQGALRRSVTFVLVLDADGTCTGTEVVRARIRSRAKLTYEGVQALYDAPEASPLGDRDFTESLHLLREVGLLRIRLAEARDVVRYNRVSLGIGFTDETGMRFTAVGEVRNDTERYNEQISLLCNAEGGRLLAASPSAHVQAIYRVHPAPSPHRLARLARLIDALVEAHGLDPAVWRWRRHAGTHRESLAAYLERLPFDGPHRRVALAIQRQALVANEASRLSAEPGPHHGVGAEPYCRFSSPMREIIGIFTHKEALELLEGRAPADMSVDVALRDAAMAAGERAKRVQAAITKEANKRVLDHVFGADLARPEAERPARGGTVLGFGRDRAYVQLDEPPLEVKVYAPDLGHGSSPSADEAALLGASGEPALRVGDAVALRVAGYDAEADRWRFGVGG